MIALNFHIERKIIGPPLSDQWDAIYFDHRTGGYTVQRVMFVVTIRETKVYGGGRDHFRDAVVPFDVNDKEFDGFVGDAPNYLGMVPAGADWRDPLYAIELPTDAPESVFAGVRS